MEEARHLEQDSFGAGTMNNKCHLFSGGDDSKLWLGNYPRDFVHP
jgi:hypothetical protein